MSANRGPDRGGRLRPMARGACALGLALMALAAWLSIPRPDPATQPGLPAVRALLVDLSASAMRTRPGRPSRLRAALEGEAREAAATGEQVLLLAFSEEVVRLFGPGPGAELAARLAGRDGQPLELTAGVRDRGSALARALEVAAGAVADPQRPPGRIALFADGSFTGPDPAPLQGRLAAAGVPVDWHAPAPPRWSDAALVALDLPPRLEAGAPLVAGLAYRWEGPPAAGAELFAELDLRLPGQPPRRVRRRLPDPPVPGTLGRASLELGEVPPGLVRVEVRLVCEPGPDPVPENDRLSGALRVEGALSVGVVAGERAAPDARRWVAEARRALPGLELVWLDPGELGRSLPDLDALISYDLDLDRLPARLLESEVRAGAGWLACGGWSHLARWDSAAGIELRPLLPLVPDPGEDRSRDVVLLVDGSGSMQGEPFEVVKRAVLELAAAAPPGDRLHLRFFTVVLHGDRPIPADGGRQAVLGELLAVAVPGGSTAIVPSLEEFALERAGGTEPCLLLLLTDGRETADTPRPIERAAQLLEDLTAYRTQLVPIAVGPEADLEFLGHLTPPGRELLVARELDELGEIFRREVNAERVREGPQLVLRAADPGADELLAALGTGDAELPAVRRYVRCRTREGTTPAWISADGDPVLGAWRVGLGRTALLATGPQAGWAPAWVERPEVLGPLLRFLARGPGRGTARARLHDGRLELHGPLGEGRELPPAVAVQVHLGAERLGELTLLLPPGGGALRSAPIPDFLRRAPRGALASLVWGDPETGAGPVALPLELSGVGEFAQPPRRAARLQAGPGPEGPTAGGARRAHPSAPAVLLTALLLLFAGGVGETAGALFKRARVSVDS